MTKNQIEYAKLLETRRANARQEELTDARDRAAREARVVELGETARHNVATERHNEAVLGETRRSNVAREAIETAKNEESKRHNLEAERINLYSAQESARHNRQTESTESRKVDLGYAQLSEQARHNVAQESETQRSNISREVETNRSNVARETETKRANERREAIDMANAAKDAVLREQDLLERGRHNRAMELKNYGTIVTTNSNPVTTVNTPAQTISLNGNSSNRTGVKSSETNAIDKDTKPMKIAIGEPSTNTWRGGGFTKNKKGFGGTTK